MSHDIPIILLAAGQSSRMRGRDKLQEIVEGEPLLRRQARIARAATRGAVIVALPPAPHPRYALVADMEVEALPVPDAAEGMNASLRAGFAALPAGTPAAMVLLADLPEPPTHAHNAIKDLLIKGRGISHPRPFQIKTAFYVACRKP